MIKKTGSLQIKNNKYIAVFSYKDATGKYKTKTYSTGVSDNGTKTNQRMAEKKLKELRDRFENDKEQLEQPTSYLVAYMLHWLQTVEDDVDIITFRSYSQHIHKHFIPYFEPMRLRVASTTIKHINDYLGYKATKGRLDGRSGGLSRSTLSRHKVVLSLIFKQAMRDGLITNNPCDLAKIPKQSQQAAKHEEFYTPEQCNQLLGVTEGTPLHDMIYVTFLYGLRRSELIGLRWCDVDFEADTINIQHTVVMSYGSPIAKDRTKNQSSRRTYPLLPDVKQILLNIKAQQDEYRRLCGNCYADTPYIFTHPDGTAYYPKYPSMMLSRILKRHNLPHIRWHDLRHSCASMLIAKGWQPKDISAWLGHSNIATTMNIYAHIGLQRKQEMSKTLSGILG